MQKEKKQKDLPEQNSFKLLIIFCKSIPSQYLDFISKHNNIKGSFSTS